MTSREQVVPDQTIGASLGDALLAAIGTGLLPRETDWSKVGVRLAPDPRHHELYRGLSADFQAIYPATRDILHRLASIQHSFIELPHTA